MLKIRRFLAGLLTAVMILNGLPVYAGSGQNDKDLSGMESAVAKNMDGSTAGTTISPTAEPSVEPTEPTTPSPETTIEPTAEPATEPATTPDIEPSDTPSEENPSDTDGTAAPDQEGTEGETVTDENELEALAFEGEYLKLEDVFPGLTGNAINIQTADEMIKLSHVNPVEYQNKVITFSSENPTLNLTGSVMVGDTPITFAGLGSETVPFQGQLNSTALVLEIILNRALFNSLSNQAVQTQPSTRINVTWNGTQSDPVWAKQFVFDAANSDAAWTFTMNNNYDGSTGGYYSFGGLIGTMKIAESIAASAANIGKLNLNASLTNQDTSFRTLVYGGENLPIGLFCGEMGAGTSLDISGSTIPDFMEINASGDADAGGLVGKMGTGAKLAYTPTGLDALTIGGNSAISSGAAGGNTGGLVGEAQDAVFDFGTVNNITVGPCSLMGNTSVGGLIGAYTYTGKIPDALKVVDSKYSVTTSTLTTLSNGNAGGLFGTLIIGTSNNGSKEEFNIDYSGATASAVSTQLSSSASNYGGLIGSCTFGELMDGLVLNGGAALSKTAPGTPIVQSSTYTSTASVVDNYGGLIGNTGANAYISITNMAESTELTGSAAANTFGGLLGTIGDNCTIRTSGVSVKGNYSYNVNTAGGGLAGSIGKGSSLYLSGVTRLETGTTGTFGGKYGQIVGIQDCSLIYAATGWADDFIRCNQSIVDDIGNYGAVVRLKQGVLTERTQDVSSASDLMSFDAAAHTVTLLPAGTGYDGSVTLSSAADFAKLALTVQSRGYFSGASNVTGATYANFNMMKKDITMNTDTDVSDTGIQGLTRDMNNESDTYQGKFDGGRHNLTLDIGKPYGELVNGGTNTIQGAMVSHEYLGLFAAVKNATVTNLTLKGSISTCANRSSELNIGQIAGYASGTTISLDNIDGNINITNLTGATSDLQAGGLIGKLRASGSTVSISNCDLNIGLNQSGKTSKEVTMGGIIGVGEAANTSFTLETNTVSGQITGQSDKYRPGAVIGLLKGNSTTTLTITNLTVGGDSENAFVMNNIAEGGLLGYNWDKSDVLLQNVKVNHAALTTDKNFGGLLYQASGRIVISKPSTDTGGTGVTITNSTFTGNDTSEVADGLLVCMGKQLYLSVDENAYSIGEGNTGERVTITKQNNHFDELVGNSINTDVSNGVVSYNLENNTDGKIDQSSCDTYINKTTNGVSAWTNGATRYYYNLSTILSGVDVSDGKVETPQELMLWSLLHYAQKSADEDSMDILPYFGTPAEAYTISGTLDMSGFSYYPVTVSDTAAINDTRIIFDNKAIETKEADNKLTGSLDSQHYLMQCGLFYNVSGKIAISGLTLNGNVGPAGSSGSGALVCGMVQGNISGTTVNYAEVIFAQDKQNILNGLYVNKASVSPGDYAPLLINKVGNYSHVTVSNLKTEDDTTETYTTLINKDGYAGTSLIGNAGGKNGTNIVLNFSMVSLDSRITAGDTVASYQTTRTLFANAAFLESFQYAAGSGSGGTYNFEESEDWDGNTAKHEVTYGREISDSKRNVDNQHCYYNSETYVHPDAAEGAADTFSTGYLPYVAKTLVTNEALPSEDNYQELDVNLQVLTLTEGCGTYGDPYILRDAIQVERLASFLGLGKGSSSWSVNISDDTTNYAAAHKQYTHNGSAWVNETTTKTEDEVRAYLNDAYYMIAEDISLSSNFTGIGVLNYEFRGVIVGKQKSDSSYPTITINAPSAAKESASVFGLVSYSYGSVVKDLNITYSGIFNVNANSNSGQSWGGVFGAVFGGDNIIDQVNVTFTEGSNVNLNGAYSRLAMVGGYTGVIEAGGVIFRNMDSAAKLTGITANGGDSITAASEDNTYFYVNPYVGRVLDGYAVYESSDKARTLENTNKNYRITTLTGSNTTSLSVTTEGKENTRYKGTITVNDAEGLFLFSAISNCGASAFGVYAQVINSSGKKKSSYISNAYKLGKVRNAAYDQIGSAAQPADFAASVKDENFGKTEKVLDDTTTYYVYEKVSYLISKYTNTISNNTDAFAKVYADNGTSWNPACCLTGSNTRFDISFSGTTYDVTSYGNGYRGIGARYTTPATTLGTAKQQDRAYVFLLNVRGNGCVIKVDSKVREYSAEYSITDTGNQPKDFKAGAVGGLFNRFMQDDPFTDDAAKIKKVDHITLSGTVTLDYYDYSTGDLKDGETAGDKVGVGGLIGTLGLSANNAKTNYNLFEAVSFENLTVSGSRAAGALLGNSNESNSNMPLNISNCTIDNCTVSAAYTTGGFIGNLNNKTFNVTIKDNTTVNNLTVKTTVESPSDAVEKCAGGLIGLTRSSVTINGNTTVNDLTVTTTVKNTSNTAEKYAGGLIGLVSSGVTISDVKLANRDSLIDIQCVNDQKSHAGGLVGRIGGSAIIQDCEIAGKGKVLIKSTMHAGGMVGYTTGTVTVSTSVVGAADEAASEAGTYSVLALAQNVGGLVGYMNNTTLESTVDKCIIQNIALQGGADSGAGSAGGILADQPGSRTTVVTNTTIKNNAITVRGDRGFNCSGGVTGKLNTGGLYGSNILWQDNLTGYYDINASLSASKALTTADIDSWKTTKTLPFSVDSVGSLKTGTGSDGLWTGTASSTARIQLAGVSRQGTVFPANEAGTSGYLGYITYADYTGASTKADVNKEGDAPYVVKNPKSGITVYADGNDANGQTMTGDAACYTDSKKTQMISKLILSDYISSLSAIADGSGKGANEIYQGAKSFYDSNGIDTDLLTSYRGVQEGTALGEAEDFPVLLLTTNDTAAVTKQIAEYLDLLTNGGYSRALELNTQTVTEVSAATETYQLTGGRFVSQATRSLMITNNNTASISYRVNPGRYDNTLDQFTLITVTFGDDASGKFELQIPVIVKQVVNVKASAVVHNDSPFYGAAYDERQASGNHILLSYGQTFTTELTYTYSQYAWKEAANTGANLHWNYDKRIDFTTAMPAGTKLTLVDPNQKNIYYSCTVQGEGASSVNLSDFSKVINGTSHNFAPVNLDSLLKFTAAADQTEGRLVPCDEKDATVEAILDQTTIFLRLDSGSDEDKALKHYTVTPEYVSKVDDPFYETYYLVVDMPTGGNAIINSAVVSCGKNKNNLEKDKNGNYLPYDLSPEQKKNENVYVVNTNFEQLLTKNSGGSGLGFSEVKKGEARTYSITDTITVQKSFASYIVPGTDHIYQQLSFDFKKKLGSSTEAEIIPAGTRYDISFTLWKDGKQYNADGTQGANVYSRSDSLVNAESSLDVMFPEDLAILISKLRSEGTETGAFEFQIKADIAFTFPTESSMEIFPVYSSTEDLKAESNFTKGYILIDTTSRMNYSESTLISGVKASLAGTTGYYQVKSSEASLKYNGDFVNQLGINVRDMSTSDTVSIINTTGTYNLSALDKAEELLQKTEKLECVLSLEQKTNSDSYQTIGDPSIYLNGIYAGKGSGTVKTNLTGSTYSWSLSKGAFSGYYNENTKTFTLPFEIRVNNEIELKSGLYSNYKITLKLTPVDAAGNPVLDPSSDFVIYTFAKVPTGIVE